MTAHQYYKRVNQMKYKVVQCDNSPILGRSKLGKTNVAQSDLFRNLGRSKPYET